jgi:hypothetical protein
MNHHGLAAARQVRVARRTTRVDWQATQRTCLPLVTAREKAAKMNRPAVAASSSFRTSLLMCNTKVLRLALWC